MEALRHRLARYRVGKRDCQGLDMKGTSRSVARPIVKQIHRLTGGAALVDTKAVCATATGKLAWVEDGMCKGSMTDGAIARGFTGRSWRRRWIQLLGCRWTDGQERECYQGQQKKTETARNA